MVKWKAAGLKDLGDFKKLRMFLATEVGFIADHLSLTTKITKPFPG